MEIQRLSLLNINVGKPTSQVKSSRKPGLPGSQGKYSLRTEDGQSPEKQVLISVSSTVADSNGIDLSDSHLSFSLDEVQAKR